MTPKKSASKRPASKKPTKRPDRGETTSRSRKGRKTVQLDIPDELPVTPVGDISHPRSFVLYGRSATGKTTLASTFPAPLLLIDIKDRGTDSVADVEDIDVYEVETLDDLQIAYWWLKKNPDRYKTIIIDTVSQMQTMAVREKVAEGKGDVSRAGDWGTMTKRDWGDVAAFMKDWLVNFRDLNDEGMEVVFIAQDRSFNFDTEEEDDKVTEQLVPEIGPALSPSVVKTLNAAVSVIGNTFIRTRTVTRRGKEKEVVEYCLRIGPNPVYVTKVRQPRTIEAPAVIINPTYEDILEVITGKE